MQSACSPCYLVCIVASRGDVREGFEGLREEADLESLGAMPKYSAGRATTRRHALRNDHGVDLHTEAASHVVRRTDWHAIGQLRFF